MLTRDSSVARDDLRDPLIALHDAARLVVGTGSHESVQRLRSVVEDVGRLLSEGTEPDMNAHPTQSERVRRVLCDLFGHRWHAVSYASKECARCGLRSGGYWTTGIPG